MEGGGLAVTAQGTAQSDEAYIREFHKEVEKKVEAYDEEEEKIDAEATF